MRSCIFQLHCHQTHSTFPLSQAEFALYFYPLAFVPVILNLVPFLAFLGPSQRRSGQPDPPLFAVAAILAVSVDFVCQNTTAGGFLKRETPADFIGSIDARSYQLQFSKCSQRAIFSPLGSSMQSSLRRTFRKITAAR